MLTEPDLATQLRVYGQWLEERTDASRPQATTSVVDVDLVEAGPRPTVRRRPVRWLVAAVVVLITTTAALAVTSRRADGPADAPTRRPVPLYVIPSDDTPVYNPSVTDGVLRPFDGLIVGTPSGSGFADPATVAVTDIAPDQLVGEWRDVELATGPAIVDDMTIDSVRIAQERDGRWLIVTAPSGETARASDVLEHVQLATDGTPHLATDPSDAIIAQFHSDLDGTAPTTYLELPGRVVVETVPGVHPLSLPLRGQRIEPETLGDRPAWHLTNDQPGNGTQHALLWMGGRDQLIVVSGTTDYSNVLTAARSLTAVDLDTWRSRVGPLTN